MDAVVTEEAGHLVMEYVPGGNLARYANANNLLSVEDVIQIGFKCCGALDYASRQGIVHRDIKPANIMVVQGTEVKVADFGAAFMRSATTTQIETIGSPAYMAPEQITGGEPGEKSDMFSLGVVLYELLTGQKPFDDATTHGLVDKIVNHEPILPSSLRRRLLPEVDTAILRALAKKPEDRHQSWAEFALALAQLGHLSVYQKTIPDSDKFNYLRTMDMLAGFSDPEIWELVQASHWSRVPAHTTILREGDDGRSKIGRAHV